MAHVSLTVEHLYREAHTNYWSGAKAAKKELKPDDSLFSKEHTYHIIFGPAQEPYKNKFEKDFKDKIIFAGSRPRYRDWETGPRNWYFIFEM